MSKSVIKKPLPIKFSRYLPAFDWLLNYRSQFLVGDLTAGIIVTSLLIPQSMAYAQLAGLPPQVGLYASILPAILYPLIGTSRVLAVGPVAVDSLMVAAAIANFSPQNTSAYLALAVTLAFLVGAIEVMMGLLRLGFLVNFLSRSVTSGFISGAAVIIAFSQVKHLLGLKIPATESFSELVTLIIRNLSQTNWLTLALGIVSVGILVYFNSPLVKQLKQRGWSDRQILPLSKSAPLIVVILGTLLVWGLHLDDVAGIKVVGNIPAGLAPLTLPLFDRQTLQSLLPAAIGISLVGYLEGYAGGQALASKRREKIDPNQELLALGVANLGAAVTGGYPVTGGVSRSVVNSAAGANTGLASIVTGLLVAVTVLFLTPLFYFLPQACLAAVIITAVYQLIDVKTLRKMWAYDKTDAIAWLTTFGAVLALGVQMGIMLGAVIALALHLWRTSHPHIAIVGRLGDSEHFRNVLRHDVRTSPEVLAVRVDASLYFANAKYLENFLTQAIADRSEIKSVLLVCSAINLIDASALEILESLIADLNSLGIKFYFAEVKGPVMDKLINIGFVADIGRDRFFFSTDIAMRELAGI
ncbi:SulP family inorganic anion transporter [Chamaesiphon minutus]|uniref:High affinity sulfate transporter 1 n=1 Tax=Chamaesiphon minutus (strain ATCC 27169 / PCC 6605) TaxID=1173020 RepID=K9UBL5_CHAP6|nr:solute carrier family 26 protein [Chamaesiphon minutus]AFY92225.1 high affinity sulfate transporter 1 [Chamaesiphon minutus PCC 6605]